MASSGIQPEGKRCVLILSRDQARRDSIESALIGRGITSYSTATAGEGIVLLFEEGCDIVVADIGPAGVPLQEAAGLLSWIESRFRSAAIGIAVAAGELPLTAATNAGFAVVLDRLPEAAVIADVVARLKNEPSERSAPPTPWC